MLSPARLLPPRMKIPPCLWAPALVLNYSPFERLFSLSDFFFRQNFPLLLAVIVASGLLLCTSVKSLPPSSLEFLPLRNLRTALRAPNTLSPLLSRLNKPPVSLCWEESLNCWQIPKSCLFYWKRLVPSWWQGKDCVPGHVLASWHTFACHGYCSAV